MVFAPCEISYFNQWRRISIYDDRFDCKLSNTTLVVYSVSQITGMHALVHLE